MADDSSTPIFKRKKTSNKPRDSSASLRSLAAANSAPPTPSAPAEEEDDGNVAIVRNKKQSKSGVVKGKAKARSKFSFGETALGTMADQIEVFQEDADGDSNMSGTDSPQRKLQRSSAAGSGTALESTETRDTSLRPSYSKSDLSELKSQTLSTRPPNPGPEDYDTLTRSKFGNLALDTSASSAEEQIIPGSAAITAAKERRQLARKAGLDPASLSVRSQGWGNSEDEDGFISLSNSTTVVRPGASKGGESRLVREEDELGEAEDEHAEYTGATERIAMGKKAGMAAEKKRRDGMLEMIDDVEVGYGREEDEEEKAWEAAQVRRATAGNGMRNSTSGKPKAVYRPAPIPEATPLPSLSAVQTRLKADLESIRAAHAEQTELAGHCSADLDHLAIQEAELRTAVASASERDAFFSSLKQFVENISDLIGTKWKALEKIEDDYRSVMGERAQMIEKRRRQDLSDDLALLRGAEVPVVLPKPKNDEDEDDDDEDEKMDVEEEKMDEFGRLKPEFDLAPEAPTRLARRQDRISRRAIRQARKAQQAKVDEDGYSTDDSLDPGSAADLHSASLAISVASTSLFADISDTRYRYPTAASGIVSYFEEWMKTYPEEYKNAFGGLALVQVWEFWARAEMGGGWNPWGWKEWGTEKDGLVTGKGGLEEWLWMDGLVAHELTVEEETTSEPEGVIGAMLTSVILPLLTQITRLSYDPYSSSATIKALELVEQASYNLETTASGAYETLVLTFLGKFQQAVAELKFLVEFAPPKPTTGEEAVAARNRVLKKGVKLLKQGLRWRSSAKGMLLASGEGALCGGGSFDLLLARVLVNKVILPLMEEGWSTGGKQIVETVVKICPAGMLPELVVARLSGPASA